MVDTNTALCAHFGAPVGTPDPHGYYLQQVRFDCGDIHNSGPTLTELGYPKLEIIGQRAAVIFIGLIAAWMVYFFVS